MINLLNVLKLVLFCFIFLSVGDRKTSKSLISNAPPLGKGLSSNAQPPGRAFQENAQGGWARLDLTDAQALPSSWPAWLRKVERLEHRTY